MLSTGSDLSELAGIGKDLAGKPVADLPGGQDLLGKAFQTDVGIENAPVPIGDDGNAWFEVTGVTADRDRTLDEVKDKVIAAWKHDKVDEAIAAKANQVKDRLAKGEELAKVAGELSLEVKTADKLTRATKPEGDLTAAVVQSAFAGPKGSAAVATGSADQSKLVLLVADAVVPPYFSGAPELVQSSQQFSSQVANDLLAQYTAQLQTQVGMTLNQTALQQALGQGEPQQPDF